MKKSIQSIFLVSMFSIILVNGCASTSTPTPPTSLNLEWLVTEKDLNRFTNDTGTFEWEPNMVIGPNDLSKDTVCRIFLHYRSVGAPTVASNCINFAASGVDTLEDNISILLSSDYYSSKDVQQLTPLFKYKHDFALYTSFGDHGQPSYLAFLYNNGLLFRATFSIEAPEVYIPDELFDEQEEVEAFLKKILMLNLDKVGE